MASPQKTPTRTPMTRRAALLCSLAFCCGASFALDNTDNTQDAEQDRLQHGEYLTTILGCGGCHTEGALLGDAHGKWLAGSRIGVAYTIEDDKITPGLVFPANLTSDKETGLGEWSEQQIVRFLRTGMDHYGKQANAVMPWPNYALLKDADLRAIAAFLKTVPPVRNPIPDPVAAGEPIHHSFVRVGVYLFVPEETAAEHQ